MISIEVGRFKLAMSLLAMSSRKGRTEGGWWVCLKGTNIMAATWLGCRKALVGTKWAISLLLRMTGHRKKLSGLMGPPFLTMNNFLLGLHRRSLAVSRDYWVWFES